jgi:hypothetical protein
VPTTTTPTTTPAQAAFAKAWCNEVDALSVQAPGLVSPTDQRILVATVNGLIRTAPQSVVVAPGEDAQSVQLGTTPVENVGEASARLSTYTIDCQKVPPG